MPAILLILVRVLAYPFYMLLGAGAMTAINKYMDKRRAARRTKRPVKIDFEGFDSQAHEHGDNVSK